jgi:hypothetical protein
MQDLTVKWSENPTVDELRYRDQGFSRTKGTVFVLPPDNDILRDEFIKNGGVAALQKHADRPTSTKFFPKMKGNTLAKADIASKFFDEFIQNIAYKNVHQIDNKTILEYRNDIGYGMRFYLFGEIYDKPVFRGLLEPFATYMHWKNSVY